MKIPSLENQYVKLNLLDLSNDKHLINVAQEPNLLQYTPSKIDSPADLKSYVQKVS
ncbi:hypothetical protein [Gaetbulibacter saemankumensis]|uniref:hypothetical protein n=1 Tax=Gaetbulibacter saemankumensis TaxID=311208 RepID=UPI0012FBB255|nr:hypothetical protein [Gaetbulibacter saemankumensis]